MSGTAVGAVTWAFAVAPYLRHIYYDQKDGSLVQDVEFSGPALDTRFVF